MLKYTVYYNDDRAEIISDKKLTGEELAERIGCDVEDPEEADMIYCESQENAEEWERILKQ